MKVHITNQSVVSVLCTLVLAATFLWFGWTAPSNRTVQTRASVSPAAAEQSTDAPDGTQTVRTLGALKLGTAGSVTSPDSEPVSDGGAADGGTSDQPGTVVPTTSDLPPTTAPSNPSPVLTPSANVKISNVAVTYDTGYAKVSWDVRPEADGLVVWGVSSDYDTKQGDFAIRTSHTILIPVLPGDVMHYMITSCTAELECGSTSDATFTVPAQ